jgi:hypothetical protein
MLALVCKHPLVECLQGTLCGLVPGLANLVTEDFPEVATRNLILLGCSAALPQVIND